MEAVVAVLRPKRFGTVSRDFHAKVYEILLINIPGAKTDNTKQGRNKQLPTTTISFELEPADALFTFIYNLSGADMGGLKGKRAVFVPPSKEDAGNSFVKGTLYCVPVDSKDKLNSRIAKNLPHAPGFYSLDLALAAFNIEDEQDTPEFRQTQMMSRRLESWLIEKHNVPGAIDLLFSVCTDDRLKRSITNPAYFSNNQSALSSGQMGEVYSRSIANESLAKMIAIEKCDITIMNPVFGSDLSYKTKVDAYVLNQFWLMGKPNYSKMRNAIPSKTGAHGSSGWYEEYPVHASAIKGDADRVRQLIASGQHCDLADQQSWAPVHYAAWHGHLDVISALLNQGECSPNLVNDDGSTALHIAALKGHVYIVELLLDHPEVDVGALDNSNMTALELCDEVNKADWKACSRLLRKFIKCPSPKIQVCLMDGTFRMLDLISGANTTVQQLHAQILQELDLPPSCANLFTLWICSKNLQLQLKSDHIPIQHLNDWKRKIITRYTDQDPTHEDPTLVWRRDAINSIEQDKKIQTMLHGLDQSYALNSETDSTAIRLLFNEAYHNYLDSWYPCWEADAIQLASLLMQLKQGDYDARKHSQYLSSDRALHKLVPVSMLRAKPSVPWVAKILAGYKQYGQSKATCDRSPQVVHHDFLSICWNLRVYGSAIFTGYVAAKTPRSYCSIYILVNDLGLHILNTDNKEMLQSMSYDELEWTFKDKDAHFEIKPKGSSKGGLIIFSKQAGLVHHLMCKLANLTTTPSGSVRSNVTSR